ncbi:acyltransferase [Proteus mirabilis]|nr:acyltransferase [Proteus mirabilis]
MNKSKFRLDINGLRAVAVLLVVLFHYNRDFISGGFIGVDVFFVISGFLMTGIIFRGIESQKFSLLKFYISRGKRIIPALTAVVFVVLILGYLLIDPISYKTMGDHGIASLLFISNIIYKNEAGYFDVDSYDKYFLHSWSLSVEWQFYIIYPIILLFLSKFFSINQLKKIIIFLAISLFLYGWYSTGKNSVSSYFMLQSRAWEMLLGGVAYLYPFKFKKSIKLFIYYLSIFSLIISAFFIDYLIPWPGYLCLLPTISAYLIISCSVNSFILSNKPFQFIGLISYSIYLVHWPLLVFINKLDLHLSVIIYFITLFLLSVSLYRLVEKKRNYGFGLIIVYLIVFSLCFWVAKDGVNSRVNPDFQISRGEFRKKFEGHLGMPQSDGIQYFNSDESNFDYILIGDSHARHFFSYIKEHNLRVASLALDGCTSTKNYFSSYNKAMCEGRYDLEVEFIKKHPNKPVIISRNWPGLFPSHIIRNDGGTIGKENLNNKIIEELDYFYSDINRGQYIYILGDTPGSEKIIFECLAKADLPINKVINLSRCKDTQKKNVNTSNEDLLRFSSKYDNVTYIDTYSFLCDSKECLTIKDGMPIYTDSSHLSKYGAEIVGEGIFSIIGKESDN